jgi:MFS family permease
LAIDSTTKASEMSDMEREFRNGWGVLIASFVGVALGLVALPFYTYGVFAGHLQTEFGWSRSQVQLPLLFQTIGYLIMLPLVGWAVDQYDACRVGLISMIAYALTWTLFALNDGNIVQFYATAFLLGITGAGTLPITWTRAVNGAFVKNRGLALGLTLMGSGVTGFLAPVYVSWLIDTQGWRAAYVGLALLPGLIGIPIIWLFFRHQNSVADVETKQSEHLTGAHFSEAIRSYRFWVIGIAFLMVSFGIGGSIPNLFQLLSAKGFSTTATASILSIIGISVIIGRLGTGYLLDRIWAPAVAAFLVGSPAAACLILTRGEIGLPEAYVATALIGLAAGAEFDIIAFLAVSYFGLLHYSKIYSFLFAMFAIGAAAAPAAFGLSYDLSGSYDFILYLCAGLFISGSLMLLSLGSYRKEAA